MEQINNNKANFQYSEIFKKPNKQKNQQNKPRKDRETIYIVLWMNIYEMLWTWTVLAQLTIEKHTLKMQSKNIWKYNLWIKIRTKFCACMMVREWTENTVVALQIWGKVK